jgi:hypothetical protein
LGGRGSKISDFPCANASAALFELYPRLMETKEVSYFDRNKQLSKQIVIIINQSLRGEWSNYVEDDTEIEEFEALTLNEYVQFKLPIRHVQHFFEPIYDLVIRTVPITFMAYSFVW